VVRDVAALTLAGLALRFACLSNPGHIVDLGTFGQWALNAADNPWNRAYEVTNANYPPGALVFFELIGRIYRALVRSDPDGSLLRYALKLPNVLFDLIGGGVAYGIARSFVDHRRALIAAAAIDLNPAIIYDSSLWGQNDSITTMTALAALWCLLRGRRVAAWVVLAFAVLNKPPVVVLAPLFVLEAFAATGTAQRRRRLIATAAGIAAALVCGYLTALPFYTDTSFIAVYERMIAWYGVGSSLYPYTSANGFNLYALGGEFFAPDSTPIVFVPLKYWADVAFVAIAASIYARYLRLRDARALLEASFLTMLTFFLVLTEMHERYLMYALTFVAPLAAIDRRYLWSAVALTVTEWLNLEYSLSYMWIESDKPVGINPKEFAPVLARLCALTNSAVAIFGLRMMWTRNAEPRGEQGTLVDRP
jgi:dolichyl-phosphate-mannose-protein mannosyltransferase